MSQPPASHRVRSAREASLPLANLLNDANTLARLLVDRLAAGDVLNAYLLMAGLHQIVNDHLHRDPFFLHRAGGRLRRRLPGPPGAIASGAARAAGGLLWHGMVLRSGHRAAAAWLEGAGRLCEELAALLVESCDGVERPPAPRVVADALTLVERLAGLPAPFRRGLLRPPSCFRSFDQAPEDVERLVAEFAGRWPDRDRPLLIAGVRSSGGYLAPLAAAWLRRRGYGRVTVATLRPGQRWLPGEARPLRRPARAGGLALVVDDPPRSWSSVIAAARDLARLGFHRDRTILLLATFPSAAQPPAELRDHPAVLLPLADWAIGRRLQPTSVRDSLAALLEARREDIAVRPLDAGPVGVARGHAQARYEVDLHTDGGTRRLLILARGVGLGYFGEHALAVAARLDGRVPELHGLDRGVLFEAWPPAPSRLETPLAKSDAAAVAAYVAERARALPLPEDPAPRLMFRGAAGELAGRPFGGLFGRAAPLGELLGMVLARRLLRAPAPAVIDNRTRLDAFAHAPSGEGVVKCDYDVGVFASDDLYAFDPVSDVALAAVDADAAGADLLRHEFEAVSGRPVEPERWLLYQLVHVLASEAGPSSAPPRTDQRPARLLLRYYCEVLLSGLEPPAVGPLCAIDVDGVLETMPLGFPATSPAGAMALRALTAHGWRPVLATGRSLDEVRDRCAAYGLAGGVAEYGAVVYVHDSGDVLSLLEPDEQEALARLRSALEAGGDVHTDPAFRHSVRAFWLDGLGRRRSLPPGRVATALAAAGARVRPVSGEYQTDFIAGSAGKARGLRVLAERLGAAAGAPLALAVGDTVSDVEMLRLARLGVVPGNADRAARRAPGVVAVRAREQRGLAEAVARLIGHRPGACPMCAPPPLAESSRLLLGLLGMEDLGSLGMLGRAARLLLAAGSRGG